MEGEQRQGGGSMTINEHVSEILDECVDADLGTCETYEEVKAWLTKKVEAICQEQREVIEQKINKLKRYPGDRRVRSVEIASDRVSLFGIIKVIHSTGKEE
jgi:hypothetical protein